MTRASQVPQGAWLSSSLPLEVIPDYASAPGTPLSLTSSLFFLFVFFPPCGLVRIEQQQEGVPQDSDPLVLQLLAPCPAHSGCSVQRP